MPSDDWRSRLEGFLADWQERSARDSKAAKASGAKPDRLQRARDFHGSLVDADLAAPGWPASVGGLDLDLEAQLDYYRMTTAAGAPTHPCPLSLIVAPTLIQHGTSQQRDRYLQPLLRADEFWCQGFSEPGAGSDLASLSTSAVRETKTDGAEVYRVNGQKVWTTMADRADWMFALVRTGPAGRNTDGITYLLIPMTSPGLTVRPLRDISGGVHFAEVFFDDVEVPVENRVGDEGHGWSIMRTSLGHERATAFLSDEFKYRRTVDQVIDRLVDRGLDADPLVRQDIARLESGVRSIAANSARALDAVLRGDDPGAVASVNRLVKSEFEQHLHSLALRAAGPLAALGSRAPASFDKGRWTFGYLMSRATTIGAGTAEIQRNTIAESVLGLPSHRGEKTRAAAVAPGTPLAPAEEDERDLRAVLSKALEAAVDLSAVLDVDRAADATSPAVWSALVEFGLPGLALDESLGGAGAEPRLLYAALEESAKALAAVPLVPTVAALEVLSLLGQTSSSTALVERITAGAFAAFAVPLDDCGWATAGADLPQWNGTALTGTVPVVAGVPVAEILLVLAAASSPESPVLVAVEPSADGVGVEVHQPLDLTGTVGSVRFDGVAGQVLASGSALDDVLDHARRGALLAVAADSIGVASRALAIATAWAGEREQFGRSIGSFQAVSHRLADLLIAIENARSLLSSAVDSGTQLLVDLAAAAALDAAVQAAEGAIQIHGGIGFTWEHPAHLLLRRAISNIALIGRPEALRDRAARAIVEVQTLTL